MREIKFRAWNKEKEIMVYQNEDDSEEYWDGVLLSDVEMVNSIFRYGPSSEYIWMQYTGLKDVNVREIYEGDIVLYDRNIAPSIDSRKYVVKWEDSQFVLTNSSETIDDFTSDIIEIIGDVYRNPNLLEMLGVALRRANKLQEEKERYKKALNRIAEDFSVNTLEKAEVIAAEALEAAE
ncbi:YopX family protein [Bacillus sp. FSL M8-0052]|nr:MULTISPECIES: YopX family protein [Bacillus]MDU0072636.1 YopX family protein [Bacillus sp. IG6]MED8020430.1 YopX family protein [Bacillus glycinifermentans]